MYRRRRRRKGNSKGIEFRRCIGKILTLRHNQSDVCVLCSRGQGNAFDCSGPKYKFMYRHKCVHNAKAVDKTLSLSRLYFYVLSHLIFNRLAREK